MLFLLFVTRFSFIIKASMSMFYQEDSLDDLLHVVLTDLLKRPFDVKASRGVSSEMFGVLLKLNNPRARISRSETKGKPFSALGELMWYLSKNNDLAYIEYYIKKYEKNSDDGKVIHGGYGPRLFNMHGKYDQVACMIDLLKNHPTTRRAVIQLIDAMDTEKKYKDIPCTCTLQFAIRDNKLHMYTNMRSNDAYIGLPHDIFCFTMIQEIIARSVGVEIGCYNHAVASLHLYDDNKKQAEEYLSEGYQSTKICMPSMPDGDPWNAINQIIEVEQAIRTNIDIQIDMEDYWKDIASLLQIHAHFRKNESDKIIELQRHMVSQVYNPYIENKLKQITEAEKQKK